jgi:HAD superfamily hydrolase (TIGR01509 family)
VNRPGNADRAKIAPHPAGRLRALIFDVDGTLADTELNGHLVACNHAFAAMGIPIRWTWDEYRELLRIPGNENRMRLALQRLGSIPAPQIEQTAARLYRIKQERYIELVDELPLRPGVERLVRQAADRGVRLAIVSTSSEPQIYALLHNRLGGYAELFDPVLGQQSGTKVGSEGRLYERCVAELALPRATVVAIEDAEDGLEAARRAGLACVVVPNDYTAGGDFGGAALVVGSLEDLDLARLGDLLADGATSGAGGGDNTRVTSFAVPG